MDEALCRIQSDHQVPDFGDRRIRYEQLGDDQLMYVDDLPVYATALGQGEPLSDQELYEAYLQVLTRHAELTKLIRQELKEMRDYPEAISRAEHQLEMLLKPGGIGGAFTIQSELEECWLGLKADPTVTDPEAKMAELGEWFAEQFKAAITREIAADPIEMVDDSFSEEE
ncbi:MAG: hypothetical protein WA949_12610 [Phormidesmis sp.]